MFVSRSCNTIATIGSLLGCILLSLGLASCGGTSSSQSLLAHSTTTTLQNNSSSFSATECNGLLSDSLSIAAILTTKPVKITSLSNAFRKLAKDNANFPPGDVSSTKIRIKLVDSATKLAKDLANSTTTSATSDSNAFVNATSSLGEACTALQASSTTAPPSESSPSVSTGLLQGLGVTQSEWEASHGKLTGPAALINGSGLREDGPTIETATGPKSQFENVSVESGRITQYVINFASGTTEDQAQAFITSLLPKDSSTLKSLSEANCRIEVVHSPTITAILGGSPWKMVHGWATTFIYTGTITDQKPFNPSQVDSAVTMVGDTGC